MAYVYRHIRLDKNEPFYIGIGSDSNGEYKRAYFANRKHNQIWQYIVSKTEYIVEILLDNLDWAAACKKEIEFISIYGRIDKKTGVLSNMTDGGDGNLGLIHTEESLKKISESSKNRVGYWKGKNFPIEMKEKMLSKRTEKGFPSVKNKISEHQKNMLRIRQTGNKYCVGRVMSNETRDKISNSNKGVSKNKGRIGLRGILSPNFGKKHSNERVIKNRNSQECKPAIKSGIDGSFLSEYCSISEAARINNIFATGISSCCRGKRGFKSYKGFIWAYKNKHKR